MPVRKLLFALLGLLSIVAFMVLVGAPLLPSLFPNLDFELLGGTARVRMLAAAALALFLIARLFLRPPAGPSRQSIAWTEFASAVGGRLTQERRGIGPLGWTGGPTVRWEVAGIGVTLTTMKDRDCNPDTYFSASFRMARPFQFHAAHQNMMTKLLYSPQLWNVVLRAVKERERQSTGGSATSDAMAFLTRPEILVGDPRLDEAFLIKSDAPDLARSFFVDAGVSCALNELDAALHGWQLSLMLRSEGEYQLHLTAPGALLERGPLEACRALMQASIRCLADRGYLTTSSARAA